MHNPIHIKSTNIVSPLGFTTASNFEKVVAGESAIGMHAFPRIADDEFPVALLKQKELQSAFENCHPTKPMTGFEKMLVVSITDALKQTDVDMQSPETLLLVSTTKGSIDLLDKSTKSEVPARRMFLPESAEAVAGHFKNPNIPVVVSNACISGIMAVLVGKDMLETGRYKNVVVSGCDIISDFVLAGFHSFQALSETPCKPYDATRNGLSLGEGAATIILSSEEKKSGEIFVAGGAVSNDANHISGPSRTGHGLQIAINKTMKAAAAPEADFISAHGTATPYNDEMEAQAFDGCKMLATPVHSLKGYFGHTLGAAGLIESVIAMRGLEENRLIKSLGYTQHGVSKPVNVIDETKSSLLRTCLKTASGFGGCNAAVLYEKSE